MEIDCDVCKKVVDHTEIFYLEEGWNNWNSKAPALFVCNECQVNRIPILMKSTPQRILDLINMGHPYEHGEHYNRGEVMDEIRRRNNEIFDGLKYPRTPDAVYKNKYTGDEVTLGNMFNGNIHPEEFPEFEQYLNNQGWSVLEHWLPVAIWTEAECFSEYKLKVPNKLTGYATEKEGCTQDHYNINCPKDCAHQQKCYETSIEKVKQQGNTGLKQWGFGK